jgi:hypothetical protein
MVSTVPMSPNHIRHLCRRGASITKAPVFGCAAMIRVGNSNWNKAAAAGFEA